MAIYGATVMKNWIEDLANLHATFFLWGPESLLSVVWAYSYLDQSINEVRKGQGMHRDAPALLVDQGPSRSWQPAHF